MMNDNKITIKLSGRLSLSSKPELPIDGLPESVQRYINTVCDIYHCPREFVTAAVFATAATAVGKRITVNEGKYKNSLVLWFVSVARSGSNKSYPMKLVTMPLRRIDNEIYQIYKTLYGVWKNTPSKERSDNEPRCPAIVLDDCTDERRSEILYLNDNSDSLGENAHLYLGDNAMRGTIGIYPELKGMFDAKNQYQNAGTAAISKLLRLFDGEPIKVDRRNGPTMLIKNPFFNILGDLQTGMLKPTSGSELFMTNGLNQRFLFCVAEDIEYPKRSHEIFPHEIAEQWSQIVRVLYLNMYHSPAGEHFFIFRGADGEVYLSEGADQLYNEYYNGLQAKKETAMSDYEASIYSKLQIQVLRLAGIVHALELAESHGLRKDYNFIHENTMEYAIRCMTYFESMAKLVYHKITEQPEIKRVDGVSRQEVLRLFLQKYPNVSQNALARLVGCSPSYISKIMKQNGG